QLLFEATRRLQISLNIKRLRGPLSGQTPWVCTRGSRPPCWNWNLSQQGQTRRSRRRLAALSKCNLLNRRLRANGYCEFNGRAASQPISQQSCSAAGYEKCIDRLEVS